MSLVGANNDEKIWSYLYAKLGNAYGTAGMMGNIKAESNMRSTNMQDSYERKLGMDDETYTAAVDNGTYTNFIRDGVGYGLVQWTFWTLKRDLLAYARSKGTSIGDMEMQLEFLCKELQTEFPKVWSTCKNASNVAEASNYMLLNFERPSNMGESVQKLRASYGQAFYDKYAPHFPYMVKIIADALYIRAGAGKSNKATGIIKDKGVYTIVDELNGWGKLKSGAGWISLKYTKKL